MASNPQPPMDDPVPSLIASATQHISLPHESTPEDAQAYESLLASLRKDLLLNLLTDSLAGTASQAVIADGSPVATSATAGSASALPATPAGYLVLHDANNVIYKIPFYKS